MELLIVIAAAVVAWVVGSLWYMLLAGPWGRIADATVRVDNTGHPDRKSALPYLVSGLALLVIAFMMNHLFRIGGIHGVIPGFGNGFGIGAFIVMPWMFLNRTHDHRPFMVVLIEAGNVILACAAMGVILGAV